MLYFSKVRIISVIIFSVLLSYFAISNFIKIDDNFLVKLSTAVTHLIGVPNHDSMSGKYYARFFVKHEDDSDSYLRKAYINMDLHTQTL